jgi:hypothetical protein
MSRPTFKTDENLPEEVCWFLRERGYDCESVVDEAISGIDDDGLIERCCREGRALITFDLDFSDIRAYPPERYAGIVVLRPSRQSVGVVLDLMHRLAPLFIGHSMLLGGKLWVCDHHGVRVRGGEKRQP